MIYDEKSKNIYTHIERAYRYFAFGWSTHESYVPLTYAKKTARFTFQLCAQCPWLQSFSSAFLPEFIASIANICWQNFISDILSHNRRRDADHDDDRKVTAPPPHTFSLPTQWKTALTCLRHHFIWDGKPAMEKQEIPHLYVSKRFGSCANRSLMLMLAPCSL